LRIDNFEEEKDQLPVPVLVGEDTTLYASWLGVPLLIGDQVLGLMSVMRDQPNVYGEEEELLLTTIADQVAVALERTRLLEDTRTRAEELTVLNEMSRDMTSMLEVYAIIEKLDEYTARLMDLTSFYVALYDTQKDEVSFPLFVEHGQREEVAPRQGGKGLTEYIIRTKSPLLIEENVAERLGELGIDSIGEVALSWLGVPMAIGERILGVIAVQSYVTPRLYDDHHRDLLVAIASQAAIAIENARLLEQTQARAERERMVRTITDRVRRGGDAEAIMRIGLEGLSQVLGTSDLIMRLGTRESLQAASSTARYVPSALEKDENE
jgi:GAF domain-containing protein